jgi:ubiquinone/menaquinone biosynthesis C-methylase UbiE
MSQSAYKMKFEGNAADNYERYFVPAIGRPLGMDLVDAAALQPGECVLDVACGTGVVTRLASERVGAGGRVAGSDINPAMLETARAAARGATIEWHQADAESLPHADGSFDAVLCQMGLQFVANKLAALREMRRVLAPAGRVVLNVPGPTPALMAAFAETLARHVNAGVASFLHLVFALHDPDELRDLLDTTGFRDIDVQRTTKALHVPPADEFMWQYICSTPMAGMLADLDAQRRAALEHELGTRWEPFAVDGGMTLDVGITTAIARR